MATKRQATALRVAKWVSLAGSPFLLAALLLLIVSWHATHRVWPALGWAALTATFVTVGPLVILSLAVCAGRVRNLDLDLRHERPWPMVIALGITIVGLTVLWILGAPRLLLILLVSTLAGGAIALLITLRWKISIHAGGAAGAATVMALLYGAQALPLLIGVALIGWSRVALGKHTWPQVVAGAAVSAVITVLVFGIGLA
ncbi:MAG TPA: phosphatase PAP2 family protein [Ktedonobacterales bacterium]|jgi:membrane-associated phospholipid phosphatase